MYYISQNISHFIDISFFLNFLHNVLHLCYFNFHKHVYYSSIKHYIVCINYFMNFMHLTDNRKY